MNYIGVDLHKKYSYITRMTEEGEILDHGRIEHDPESLETFVQSISRDDSIAVEATCNWYYFYELLENQTPNISLAHPLKTRIIAEARVKTDKIDSKTLAHLLRADLLPESYIPTRETRDLREKLRYRASLVKVRTQLKNKVHAILSKNGISSPFSDVFGKGGLQFLNSVELRPSYRQALDGYLEVIGQLDALIKYVSDEIDQQAELDEQAKLLLSIPGIGPYSAMLILAEIGDIHRFPDSKRLVSYAGLAPGVHSSGGKTHHGHITKQGSRWLRWILTEASHHVAKTRRLAPLYNRVRKKHGKNAAKIAVARKLLSIIYHLLTEGEEFDGQRRKGDS